MPVGTSTLREAELRALLEPALGLRRRAEAAGQAELAERGEAGPRPRRLVAAEAIASAIARSAPGSSIRTPPATLTKTSALPSASRACRASTATIIARRFGSTPVATRRGIARSVGETSAWISSRIGRVPSSAHATAAPISPASLRPKSSDGLGHADEPGAGHLEDADLVRRAEAVLRRAQDPVRAVAVALELEHAVDEVLEHARAGDGAVLRHVADEEDRDAVLLRDAQEARGRLAHLRDRARRRAELRRVERLHRVDHADLGPLALERRADRLELGLGEHLDPLGAAEPRRRGASPAPATPRR